MYYFFIIIMLTNKTKMTIIAYNSVTKLQTYLYKIYVLSNPISRPNRTNSTHD